MRTQLLHLSGPLRGRTITYEDENLLVGSDPDAQVRYEEGTPAIHHRHAEIAFRKEDCAFYMRAIEGKVFVEGQEIKEVILNHGDLIEFGVGGPRARFRVHMKKGTTCKPVRLMLGDARDVGRSSGIFAFSHSLVRDLAIHSSLRLRVILPLLILLVVGAVYAVPWWRHLKEVEIYEQDLARVQSELEEGKKKIEVLLSRGAKQDAALKSILRDYSKGVCLLHGIWGLQREESGKMVDFTLSGQRFEVEYVGSGFLASSSGHVVTNRHVAEPWWQDRRAEVLDTMGWKPHFRHLTASFPGHDPIDIDPESIKLSQEADVAVLEVAVKDVPVLPLFRGNVNSLSGGKVVVLGYPTGVNALLAKTDAKVRREVTDAATDLTTLIADLARRKVISPHVTQGSLGQVLPTQLVYDAVTTSGGSGGPVFSADGEVIGVNAAIMREFSGANFGVLIKYVLPLLE